MAADPIKEDKKPLKKGSVASRTGIFVLIVILCGIAVWYWAARTAEGSAANAQPRVHSTLHLETFVLNLADTDQRSYLRVGIDLGLNRELKREEAVPVAAVRDTILSVLGEAKVVGLMTPAGKVKLKEDVLRALRKRMPDLGVEEVYFTEFLIQR
jgi:flagellar basal body-associated protein FliL